MIVVLMGVSGSGKTTIGELLSARTGAVFADADDYHSTANKEKLAAGIALDDEDRRPWLEELNRVLLGWSAKSQAGVMACSALKESHRQALARSIPEGKLKFVLLDGSRELIAQRLRTRVHTFMNPKLLDSQLQTLERPVDAFRVVNDRAPDVVVSEILAHLGPRTQE